ncbi:MAG: hypothetical protein AAF390_09210 [Pseudomonadota bacterium]
MAHRGNHTIRLSLLALAILAGLALQKVDAHKQAACDQCLEEAAVKS